MPCKDFQPLFLSYIIITVFTAEAYQIFIRVYRFIYKSNRSNKHRLHDHCPLNASLYQIFTPYQLQSCQERTCRFWQDPSATLRLIYISPTTTTSCNLSRFCVPETQPDCFGIIYLSSGCHTASIGTGQIGFIWEESNHSKMSSQAQETCGLGEEVELDSIQLTLRALTSPKGHANPYNFLDSIPRPELQSDLTSKTSPSYRNASNASTISSAVASLFSGIWSGTSSAATSPTNSSSDHIPSRALEPAELMISRWSAYSTDFEDQSSNDRADHIINKGAISALVQGSAKTGMLRGAVDVWAKHALYEKWSQEIWDMIDNPEKSAEVCLLYLLLNVLD